MKKVRITSKKRGAGCFQIGEVVKILNNKETFCRGEIYGIWEDYLSLSTYYNYEEIKEYPTLLHKILGEEFRIFEGDKFNINTSSLNPYIIKEGKILDKYGVVFITIP